MIAYSFEQLARRYRIAVNDIEVSTGISAGAWVVRESMIAALTGPVAVWGRVNQWLPLQIARTVALRTSKTPDEPAMRTIVAGLASVAAFSVMQTMVVAWRTDSMAASLCAASLPASATRDLIYADRRRRAVQRVRTNVPFWRAPALQEDLLRELKWPRREAAALAGAVSEVSSRGSDVRDGDA